MRATATSAGSARARLTGTRLPLASRHVAAILLTDARSGQPVTVDYRPNTAARVDARGRIVAVHLTIPRGTALPPRIRAYVILDAFPLAQTLL